MVKSIYLTTSTQLTYHISHQGINRNDLSGLMIMIFRPYNYYCNAWNHIQSNLPKWSPLL